MADQVFSQMEPSGHEGGSQKRSSPLLLGTVSLEEKTCTGQWNENRNDVYTFKAKAFKSSLWTGHSLFLAMLHGMYWHWGSTSCEQPGRLNRCVEANCPGVSPGWQQTLHWWAKRVCRVSLSGAYLLPQCSLVMLMETHFYVQSTWSLWNSRMNSRELALGRRTLVSSFWQPRLSYWKRLILFIFF